MERFNRTLKSNMWKKISLQGSYKWIDILPELISKYNNTKHQTIGMKTKDVNHENELIVLQRFFNGKCVRDKPKFKVSDKVRISKYKHIFEKGYTPNYTKEVFKVEKIKPSFPFTYELKGYQGNSISGGFYEFELQKASNSDVYLIEKVLTKRENKIFVKWLGFDNSHNSWIDKTDL